MSILDLADGDSLREPEHPCRVLATRGCPASYRDVCGDRPCARYESNDETPWLADVVAESTLGVIDMQRRGSRVHFVLRENHGAPVACASAPVLTFADMLSSALRGEDRYAASVTLKPYDQCDHAGTHHAPEPWR